MLDFFYISFYIVYMIVVRTWKLVKHICSALQSSTTYINDSGVINSLDFFNGGSFGVYIFVNSHLIISSFSFFFLIGQTNRRNLAKLGVATS